MSFKKNCLYKVSLVICFTCQLFFVVQSFAQNERPFVIPALRQWEGGTGYYKIKATSKLVVANSTDLQLLKTYLHTFQSDLKNRYPTFSFSIKVGKPLAGDIFFMLGSKRLPNNEEAYQLKITNYIAVEAGKPIGAFWATRTILQILNNAKIPSSLPKGKAIDFPAFPLRGFMIDVGRKFFTIDFLRSYVKFMSYYKMNDFHIHLNDNGFKKYFNNNWDSTYSAFRLENKTYPGLTAKDGSYSKKEFIELQELAISYGVTIVPEIDVPAHSLAFTKAIPAIASAKYGKDHLDINNPLTYEVVDKVFKEYLEGPKPVFIGNEVHIGTDEYAKEEAESFRAFTDHYIKYVESFGKKVRMWGALTHAKGNTPVKVNDVTLNLWYNGYANPKDMLALGYKGISTPDGWLYIVPKAGYYYDYLNVKNIYKKWTPSIIGDQVFDENNSQIRGGSFAVWNDHVGNGITEKDVHDRVYPAMQVLSQKMWDGSTADSLVEYSVFETLSKNIGEGPGLNIRGKLTGKNNLVLQLSPQNFSFKDNSGNDRNALSIQNIKTVTQQNNKVWQFNKQSKVELPVVGIGYDYTISFLINPNANNDDDAVIFTSNDATVKLKQQHTGKLGFSREGYDYNFNYAVAANEWSHIIITGDNKGTSLYVNGQLIERLEGAQQLFNNEKDKMAKVQTLFFPLHFIGNGKSTFIGFLGSVSVFNKILSGEEIRQLTK